MHVVSPRVQFPELTGRYTNCRRHSKAADPGSGRREAAAVRSQRGGDACGRAHCTDGDSRQGQAGLSGRAKQATAMPVLPSPGSAMLQRELNHTGISWSPVQGPGKGRGSLGKTWMAMGTCLGGSSYVR